MRRFTYPRIKWEDYECKLWYYPLRESSAATSRLTQIDFCTLLNWLTWWLWPSWSWGSDPGGRYWETGSCESSLQASLSTSMIEDFLICHYFPIVMFSCIVNSECSSTRFFQLRGNATLIMWSLMTNYPQCSTWGKAHPQEIGKTW